MFKGGDNPSCPGAPTESRPCGEPCRTRWGEWSRWGSCDKSTEYIVNLTTTKLFSYSLQITKLLLKQ